MGKPIPPGLSLIEFKAKVKVGDIVYGYCTRKRVQVTAIGEVRFLYKDPEEFVNPRESVAMIESVTGRWALES